MNKLQKIGIATLIGLGVIGSSAYIFADDIDSSGFNRYGNQEMKGKENGGFLKQFLRTDLTDAEKTALVEIQKKHQEAMIAFMETNKDNLEDTTVQAELKTLKDSHINDLLPYITTDKQDEFKEFMANMKPGMGNKGPNEGPSIKAFIRTDLTDAEKTALAALIKTHKEALKTFMETNKGKMDDATVKAELKTLKENQITALLPYIATDKQDEFKEFVKNNKPSMGDKGPRGNGNGMGQGPMAPALSPAISEKLDAKLAKFSTDAEKISWLEGVSTKIDTLISKYKSEKNKNILKALKDVIASKIDELNGNTTDEEVIDSIFE